jgi:predicted helicase
MNASEHEVFVKKGQKYTIGYTVGNSGKVEPVQRTATRDMTVSQRTWIGELIEHYKFVDGKPLGERNPKGLQDDYVKFIRFAQWRIEQTGYGVLAFITNHGYLDNPTFRGMRQSLMQTFDEIYLLDLHGQHAQKRKGFGRQHRRKRVCDTASIDRRREDIFQHLIDKPNVALLLRKQYKGDTFSYVLVTKDLVEARYMENAFSHVYVHPLYLYPTDDLFGGTERTVNFAPAFLAAVSEKLGRAASDTAVDAEEIFYYAYAVFHSPTYRVRYAEFLKIDFPRLPLTSNEALFTALSAH